MLISSVWCIIRMTTALSGWLTRSGLLVSEEPGFWNMDFDTLPASEVDLGLATLWKARSGAIGIRRLSASGCWATSANFRSVI